MSKKVYIETTIPSFYFSHRKKPEMIALMQWTREWWDRSRSIYEIVSSTAVLDELMEGEHPFKKEKLSLMKNIPLLEINDEIEQIVEVYLKRNVMPKNPTGDALHLAIASYYECDILLTWNCAHLANANKFGHIHRVNISLGLKTPILTTPLELMEEDQDDS